MGMLSSPLAFPCLSSVANLAGVITGKSLADNCVSTSFHFLRKQTEGGKKNLPVLALLLHYKWQGNISFGENGAVLQ